ncbi:MAG: hypothetical protein WCF36_13150 [Candidatus Nanopelagicales bacterium]
MVKARTSLGAGMTGATLVLAALMAPVAPAAAGALMCEPGSSWEQITGTPTDTLTHITGYQAPPGGSLPGLTADATVRLTAAVEGRGIGARDAAGIIDRAATQLSVRLAPLGQATSLRDVPILKSTRASSRDTYYAAFAGRQVWRGDWVRHQCASEGRSTRVVASGTWQSYGPQFTDLVTCPAQKQPQESLAQKACRETWG